MMESLAQGFSPEANPPLAEIRTASYVTEFTLSEVEGFRNLRAHWNKDGRQRLESD
jgi:hypothetical protein